jgi:hypothetical protein
VYDDKVRLVGRDEGGSGVEVAGGSGSRGVQAQLFARQCQWVAPRWLQRPDMAMCACSCDTLGLKFGSLKVRVQPCTARRNTCFIHNN